MIVYSLADITGDGSAHSLVAAGVPNQAAWVQIGALSTNLSSGRWGDANIGANRGMPLGAGYQQLIPTHPSDQTQVYSLNQIYYYLASGDKLSVVYAI